MNIIHVSLSVDVIATPNPFFMKAAIQALADHAGIGFDEAADHVETVERAISGAASKGLAFNVDSIFEALMDTVHMPIDDAPMMRERFERLFEMMPPKVSTEAIQAIDYLHSNNFSVSVAANTSFIGGKTIDAFLRRVVGPFAFGAYSDLIGVSKPAPTFYRRIIDAVAVRRELDVYPASICHIGVDVQGDGFGSQKCGLSTIVVQREGLFDTVRALGERQALAAANAIEHDDTADTIDDEGDDTSDDFNDNPFA